MSEVLKTFNVALDMKNPTAQRYEWEVVEGDNGNVLKITVTDDSVPVDLTDCLVLCVFGLPNGMTVEQDTEEGSVTIGGTDHNVITVRLATGSFSPGKSSSGLMKAEVQIYSGLDKDTLITSAQYTFKCRRAIINYDTVPADNNYPILVELIQEVQSFMRTAQSDWNEADNTKPEYIRNKPSALTPTAHASTHAIGGTDALPAASSSQAGLVKLIDSTSSTATDTAATAAAVKSAYDLAGSALQSTDKGAANGVASLDANSKVVAGQASAAYVTLSGSKTMATADAGITYLVAASCTIDFGTVEDGAEFELWNTGTYTVNISGSLFVENYGAYAAATLDSQGACCIKKMSNTYYVSGDVSV